MSMKKHFLALVMLCTRVFSVFTHKKKDLTIYIFTRFIYLYKYSSMYLFLLLIHLYVYLFIINLLIYAFITFFIICLFIHYFFYFKPRIVLISNYNVYICKWTSLLHHIPKYSRPCISMCIKKNALCKFTERPSVFKEENHYQISIFSCLDLTASMCHVSVKNFIVVCHL